MRPFALPPARYPFYDRLVFGVFILLLPPVLASGPGMFDDGDVAWHIAAGRWIREHGRIPQTDPFSFTMAGEPWVAHEWLAEILYSSAFDLAGHAGLAALVAIALMALHLAVFIHLRPRAGPVAMVAAFAAMDLILAKFLLARPHVLIWPLLALWTSVLLASRERGTPPPPILALLMLVWTNLHGSFVLGLVIAGAIGLDAIASSRWRRPIFLGWLNFGLLATLAALLNANGADGLIHPFSIVGMETLPLIDEWKPSSPRSSPLFFVLLFATLAAIAVKRSRPGIGESVLLALLAALALSQIRHQSWLAIVGALIVPPMIAGRGRAMAPTLLTTSGRRSWIAASAALAVLLVSARLVVPAWPDDSPGNPRRLIGAVPDELRSQPLLNDYSFGGPLILAEIRPYVDGRADMYGDAFFADYVRIANHGDIARFKQAVERYDLRWTMLRRHQPLAQKLDTLPGWRRIYQDETGVIHVRLRQSAPPGGPVAGGARQTGP